ncbi:MAG: hypothetical protein AAF801_03805 [Pseudomonadota bacterium]
MKKLNDQRVDAIAMLICLIAIPAVVFLPFWGLLSEFLFPELLYALVFGVQILCVVKLQRPMAKQITNFLTDGEE